MVPYLHPFTQEPGHREHLHYPYKG